MQQACTCHLCQHAHLLMSAWFAACQLSCSQPASARRADSAFATSAALAWLTSTATSLNQTELSAELSTDRATCACA